MGTKEQSQTCGSRGHYGYKRLPSGKRMRVAPWEAVAGLAGLVGIYCLIFVAPQVGAGVGIGLLFLALGGAVILALGKSWRNPVVQHGRQSVAIAWGRVCPPLIVEERQATAEPE
jgi:hypothetical protein